MFKPKLLSILDSIYAYLYGTPNVLLAFASPYTFDDCARYFVDIFLQHKSVDILQDLLPVLNAQGLPNPFDECGVAFK